jgi:peroxiredoxin (alkyl hydroperoxide reductase subunit C)
MSLPSPPALCHPVPRLDEPAPYFEARSTHGYIRLSDYKDRWLVFFSHPADFTPVCASEFVSFTRRGAEFRDLNCALLGLSVDSVYSHIAWRDSIRQRFGVTIDFPIIDDVSLQVSHLYGLTQSAGGHLATVRALFIIDERGVLRAMLWYPVSTGRSVDEVLRLVRALQTSDRQQVLTPEGWKPGEKTVEIPPDTVEAVDVRRDIAFGCVDWYYRERDGEHPAHATRPE